MSIKVIETPPTTPPSSNHRYHATPSPSLSSSLLKNYEANNAVITESPSSIDVLSLFSNVDGESSWISSDPRLFDTHFIQLTKRKIKGQAKYQCRMCMHEFTCCGKRRRLQHILGDDLVLGKTKNVINCRTPYLPLKHALIQTYQKKLPQLKDDDDEEESGKEGEKRKRNHRSEGHFEDLIPNLHFNSTDDGDESHDSSMSEGMHDPISSSLSTSPSGDDMKFIPKRIKKGPRSAEDTYNSNLAASNDSAMSISTDPGISLKPKPLSAESVSNYNNRVHLNRAILNFFFIYRIPLSAVENQDFQEFMNAVRSLQQQ